MKVDEALQIIRDYYEISNMRKPFTTFPKEQRAEMI